MAAGLPETRLLGSRMNGCGQGPCARIAVRSVSLNATGGGSEPAINAATPATASAATAAIAASALMALA